MRVEGGREINRAVDLETMPLYVAAGTILPLGPVKQYTAEETDQPLSISIYPGADGSFLLYEDDGRSFDYRRGRMDGHATELERRPTNADTQPRAWFADARTAAKNHFSEALKLREDRRSSMASRCK